MDIIKFEAKDGEQIFFDDELLQMEIYLERARKVLQDVANTFFNYDPYTRDGQILIRAAFDTYRIKTDIVSDYAHQAHEKLLSLREMVKEVQGA